MSYLRRCFTPALTACLAAAGACKPVAVTEDLFDTPDDWFGANTDGGIDSSVPDDAAPPSTEGTSCAEPLDITSSVDSSYTGIATGRGSNSGSCSKAGEAGKGYYLVQIVEPGNYYLYADPLAGYDDPAFASASMFMRTRCDDAKSEIACSNQGTRELSVGFEKPQTVYVVVDGNVYTKAPFTLGITKGDACTSHAECKGFVSEHCNAHGVCAEGGGDITQPDDPTEPDAGATMQCEGAMLDCDGDDFNGCETDGANDSWNCGGCYNECGTSTPHTESACVDGQCVSSCTYTRLDCDNSQANGCEVDGSDDNYNCGACGNQCATDLPNMVSQCERGSCVASCASPWRQFDCNGKPMDGCECSAGIDAKATCEGTVCKLTCERERGECDGDVENGCETKTAWNDQHCGGCQACDQGEACVASGCIAAPTLIADTAERGVDDITSDADAVYWLEYGGQETKCSDRMMRQPYSGKPELLAGGLCVRTGLVADESHLYLFTVHEGASQLTSIDKALGTVSVLATLPTGSPSSPTPFGDDIYFLSGGFSEPHHLYRVPKAGGEPLLVEQADGAQPSIYGLTSVGDQFYASGQIGVFRLNAQQKLELACPQLGYRLAAVGDDLLLQTSFAPKLFSPLTCEEREIGEAMVSPETLVYRGNTMYSAWQWIEEVNSYTVSAFDLKTGTLRHLARSPSYYTRVAEGVDGLYFTAGRAVMRVPYEPPVDAEHNPNPQEKAP